MNILMFGPNGSGKGTQGAIVKDKYNLPHIESGAIFRENISKGTELGAKAKEFIDRGDLVPDDITIPMILDRLKQDDCGNGWLLDGFPRSWINRSPRTGSWAGDCAQTTTTILIINLSTPSSRTGTNAGFAAGTSQNAPMTRTKPPSTNATVSITMQKQALWPLPIISRT